MYGSVYKNDGKPVYEKIDIEDAKIAAKEWAEGNKKLEELLIYCIENEVETIACCAGHRRLYNGGYITFKINDEKASKCILQLASQILEEKALKDISFAPSLQGASASFYSKDKMEDRLFSQILLTLREIIAGQEKTEKATIKRIQDVVNEACTQGRELNIDVQENGKKFCVSSRIDLKVLTEEQLLQYIESWRRRREI